MAFKCGLCHQQVKPGTKAERVVTERREKQYPKRENAHQFVSSKTGLKTTKDDPGGVGMEIVTEVLACPPCARLSAMKDEDIDTSDIPEVTDWSGAVVGKFYRPRPNAGV